MNLLHAKSSTSTSLFARALATENIFVCFDPAAKTATFNLETRALVIPDWKVSDGLRDMIVAHEVAHALFTPPEVHANAIADAIDRKLNKDGYKMCLNIIEDARIERLIKEKFPGCRRDFYTGYKEIQDNNIFGVADMEVEEMSIVDKINLHFKFGLFGLMNISFTSSEQKIVSRVATAKTYDDVVSIANDLYEMFAEECKQKQLEMVSNGGTDLVQKIEETFGRDGEINPDGTVNKKKPPFISFALPRADSSKMIVSSDVILKEFDLHEADPHAYINNYKEEIREMRVISDASLDTFRKEVGGMVRELVMQFERRKAAEEIRNERMKDSGTINPDKLHQFKTHDDIFLRNMVKHDGKKHGMVMLIDWSGSMDVCVDGVVRQVLLLTWFCRKAKIPYEVFLFTNASVLRSDGSHKDVNIFTKKHQDCFGSTNHQHKFDFLPTRLAQVLTSSMTNADHERMEKYLWFYASRMSRSDVYRNHPHFMTSNAFGYAFPEVMAMGGTPTIEAMMGMHDYLPKFREASGSDIVDFILVTDGDPNGLSKNGPLIYEAVKGTRVQHLPTGRTITILNEGRYGDSLNIHLQHFLADEIRKLGIITVGFSVGSMSGIGSHYINRMIRPMPEKPANKQTHREWLMDVEAGDKKYNDFYRRENFIPASPDMTPGFDEYYIVRPIRPVGDMGAVDVAAGSTLTKIRNQFVKSMTGRKCSRVFLSRFIDLIAGRKLQKFKPI